MFYTDFYPASKDIAIRGYDSDGKRFITTIPNSPTIYLPSKDGQYLSVTGKRCEKLEFDNIFDAKRFVNDFKDIENAEIFGFEPELQHYAIINDYFGPDPIQFDFNKIVILNFDIEVWAGDGFPDPMEANGPVISFAGSINGKKFLIAYDDYTPPEDVRFIKVASEQQLLLKVIELFNVVKPDILTGWNIEFFDIPYLINRIQQQFSYYHLSSMSPFYDLKSGGVTAREVMQYGKKHTIYDINGITILDYIDVYKKFTYHDQPSYRLDYIAEVELGYGKLDYSEYASIHDFYLNDKQKFFDYNLRDVEIVDALEKKFGFLNLIVSMALDARTRFKDVLGTVRYSDVYIHNFLKRKGLLVQMRLDKNSIGQGRTIKGAYVKQPEPGKYTNIISFDLSSMYPHLIMQYNISPETMVGKVNTLYQKSLQSDPNQAIDFLIEKLGSFADKLKSENVGMTANGLLFRNDRRGFLPEVMEMIFNDRKKHKKAMIEAEMEIEKINEELRKRGVKT